MIFNYRFGSLEVGYEIIWYKIEEDGISFRVPGGETVGYTMLEDIRYGEIWADNRCLWRKGG